MYKKYNSLFTYCTQLQKVWLLILMFVLPLTLMANSINIAKAKENKSVFKNTSSDILWEAMGLSKSKLADKTIVVGGDFSIDFVAAAPYTYDHSTGGGAFDDRTIGKENDVVESLEGGDFTCGDQVTYLTEIVVADDAIGSQTIELDYSFLADATGQTGVALGDITYVGVNYGVIDDGAGDGPGGTDSGIDDDYDPNLGAPGNGNGSIATLSNEHITGSGELFDDNELVGTVTITDLEAGETVIIRIDVEIYCLIPSSPTGNLQGAITAGRVPTFSGRNGVISIGNQTVPFKNVNLIGQGACTLNDYAAVCEGDIQNYTATSSATTTSVFAWTLTGDAVFVDANGATISNPGNSATARVKATAPTGGAATGCYKVVVSVTADQHTAVECCDLVTVNAIPPAPTVSITEPSICGTTPYGSVTVTCPLNPSTGDPIYEYQNGSTGAWQTSPIFGSIAAGAQFSIRVRRIGTSCTSAATDCTNYTTRTCTTPSLGSCGLTACPTSGTTSLQSESSSSLKGITGEKERDITAYPVPFRDRANIEFKSERSGNYAINLYDSKGKLIKELKAGKAKAGQLQSIEVDGRNLPEGMYFIRVVDGMGSRTVKLLKKE
ncbi:T9SS type A sorting domain-containing protein [Pontibacter populi]|uniref:T9SS type A sorting domain-containing protein n=1 Tax=Pontibacter populi TaxID=890055 RepID=A0ABV1RPD9_9BACT